MASASIAASSSMRIKKEKGNWRASVITTRDARHDKSSPEVPRRKRRRRRKNTKKWCKGIVGRKHDLEWTVSHWEESFCQRFDIKGPRRKQASCKNCKKVIEGWVSNWELWQKDPNELYNK